MSDRSFSMTEEEFEQRQNQTHYLGQAAGLEAAAAKLKSESGEAFAAGRDQEAVFLRNASARIAEMAAPLRDKWRPR